MLEVASRAGARITRRHVPDGWELARGRPALRLRALVRGYEGYRETLGRPLRRRELPSATIPVIVNFGAPYRILDPADPDDRSRLVEHRGGFVAGLHDTFSVTESTGAAHCLQINLSPLGAFRLFRRPMSDIAHQVVALEDLLGRDAALLAERLIEQPGWTPRFEALDAMIAARLAEAPRASPEVAWAWRQLTSSGGQVPIATRVEELGWSPKRLIARFREQIGLTPKQAARLVRFERAAAEIAAGETGFDWDLFAPRHGFYDQSHLINEFRRFAGDTPEGLLRRRLPGNGGFASD